MRDLISRSEVVKELDKYEKELREDRIVATETDDEQMLFAIINQETAICRIRRNILNMTTAYDIDKVVQQIKSLSPANYVSKDDVLKIVKGGGTDGKS